MKIVYGVQLASLSKRARGIKNPQDDPSIQQWDFLTDEDGTTLFESRAGNLTLESMEAYFNTKGLAVYVAETADFSNDDDGSKMLSSTIVGRELASGGEIGNGVYVVSSEVGCAISIPSDIDEAIRVVTPAGYFHQPGQVFVVV